MPIRDATRSLSDMLGFDTLNLANEGKLIAFVPSDEAEKILDVMKSDKNGKDAAIIGETVEMAKGQVGLKTELGAIRVVEMPMGEIVPRIC